MAEARQGIRPTPAFGIHERQIDATSQNVQFVYGRTGLHIYIPRPRILFRKFLRLLWRTGNKLQDACYPLPTWSIFVSNSVALFLVVGSESSLAQKYLQKHGKGMKYLWAAPLAKHLPEVYHRAMFAVNATSVSLFLFTSFHRAIIRHLLSYTGWVHELRAKNPSWMTKIWAFILRYGYIRSKSPLMLTYQNCLPKLPLPRLDDTVHGYLKTIEPLLDAEEIARQQNLAKNFLANEGKTLQRFLRVKHFFSSNYISNWWLEIVYLRHRKSLTLNSNYYGIGCAHGRPTQNQVSRAAVLIHNFVRCKLDIDHERIPPHLMNNFIPLCMDQYLHAFSVTRVPGMVQDQLAHYSSTTSRHVIVLHRGRIFAAPCFSTHTGRPLTAKQIETTLLGIVQDSSTVSETEAAIPILTSLPRSQWATLRETHFTQDPTNRTSLERIESALFVVSLEDVTPSDLTSEGLNYYLGNMGQNRWADKSFHLIVTADGRCGITAEHSWGDAPVIAHLLELSIAREVSEKPYDADGTVRRVARDVQKMDKSQFAAEPLHFNITSELSNCIHEAIPVVEADFRSLDLKVGCYDQYGKGAVKKFRCGADAWIQIALQLAYYRDQGHFDLTYESGMTRLFRYGRTETIRSVSKSSCAFVRAIDDAAVAPSKKATLLREACEAHQSYSHNAMVGNGVDRHLLALYIVSVGMGMKSDFLADYIARPWKLSTSQIPQRQTAKGTWPGNDMGDRYVGASGGFGPVAEDGYGISYTIAGEFRIYFHISSKHEASNTDSKRMLQNVFRALDDMRALFPDVDLKDVQMPKEIAALSYNDTWS